VADHVTRRGVEVRYLLSRLQNDIVAAGYATVGLSAGQGFEDHGRGTFVVQQPRPR
jgi:hypothetical protein